MVFKFRILCPMEINLKQIKGILILNKYLYMHLIWFNKSVLILISFF